MSRLFQIDYCSSTSVRQRITVTQIKYSNVNFIHGYKDFLQTIQLLLINYNRNLICVYLRWMKRHSFLFTSSHIRNSVSDLSFSLLYSFNTYQTCQEVNETNKHHWSFDYVVLIFINWSSIKRNRLCAHVLQTLENNVGASKGNNNIVIIKLYSWKKL